MTQNRVELRILGHTELSTSGPLTGGAVLRQPKRLALLAYFALAASEGFRRRDQIVALFWPEQDQLHARTQLRKVLYAMRGVVGADAFTTRGEEEIRLNTDRVWCDAVAFRRHVHAGEWQQALALHRGDLLEGLFPGGVGQQFEEWLDEQRSSLRQMAARAAWEASSRADLAGERAHAIALARRAVELVPDDEEGIRRLIAALDRHGDRAGALRLFSEWRTRLKAEFGAEPAPETRKLVRRVQAHRQGESAETPHAASVAALAHTTPAAASPLVRPQVSPTRGNSFAPASAEVRRPDWRRRLLITSAILAAAAVAGGSMFYWHYSPAVTESADVAVLPFRAFGDAAAAEIGEGIAEELTTTWVQQSGIRVRSTARSREALSHARDVSELGRVLAVKYVIDGSVRRDGRRLHVTMRVVRVSDALTLWARSFDLSSDDLITAQEQLANTSLTALAATVVFPPRR
jgi:DNA-binding SARP family transcriptional activator/TolB-like protein